MSASYTENGVTKTATFVVTVKAAAPTNTLSSLFVSGGSSVTAGSTLNLVATAYYTNGTGSPITPTRTVSNSNAATISNTGVLTGLNVATDTPVTVTATYTEAGVTQTATITVTAKAVVVVTPTCPSIQNVNSGGNANLTISATVAPCPVDVGKQSNIYVAAIVPIFGTNTILFLTPTGWTTDTSGLTNPPVYKKGLLAANTSIPLVAGVNLSSFKGLSIVVGYGTGQTLSSDTAIWNALIANGTYSVIYTIQ